MGDRQVSESPPEARVPSPREGQEAGSTIGAVEGQPSLQSRQATPGPSSSGVQASGSGARPYRPAQAVEVPRREPEGSPDIEAPQHVAKRVKLNSDSAFSELPWLTTDQNAERRTLQGLLTELRDRPDVPSKSKDDLADAVGLVSRLERDMLRADELLQGIRTKLMTEAEWRELAFLVERARSNMPLYRGKVMDTLDRLVESGALSSALAGLLQDSMQRLVAAHEYLTSEELPWRDVARRVELPLRADSETTALVESRVIPGTAFGGCLARGYSWDDNAHLVEQALSAHVPCLAQTTLTGATGQLLFSGLRQGFISLGGLHGATVSALSDANLRTLVSEVILGERQIESPEGYRIRVEQRCRLIRSRWVYADGAATIVQHRVGVRMAMESAAAAICADPDKFQRALGGETVDVKLFDVALLTGDEFRPWTHQYAQHRDWADGRQLRLHLRGPDNALCGVSANVNVRQFALSVEDQGPDFSNYDGRSACVVQLLGRLEARELGGDVLRRIEFLHSRIAQLGGEFTAAGYEQVRTLPPRALEQTGGLEARNRISGLQAEMARLERNARALEQAGRQLKHMWADQDEWPTGADAYKAAARLALVAYLMGETPVLSCLSGRNYTEILDAEVKILATVTDCQGGQVPPADPVTEIWDPARAVLRGR